MGEYQIILYFIECCGKNQHVSRVCSTSANASFFTEQDEIYLVLLDFSLSVKAATLIFISGCGSAISSAKQGESGFIYSLVKS